MRPKFALWSDYGAPTQKLGVSGSNRHTWTLAGSLSVLAAIMFVASFLAIHSHILDAGTQLSKIFPFRAGRSGVVAIPLGVPATRDAADATLAPDLSHPRATPEWSGQNPTLPSVAAPEPAHTKPAASVLPVKKPKMVKKVARIEHNRRDFAGAFAEYKEWGWPWRRER